MSISDTETLVFVEHTDGTDEPVQYFAPEEHLDILRKLPLNSNGQRVLHAFYHGFDMDEVEAKILEEEKLQESKLQESKLQEEEVPKGDESARVMSLDSASSQSDSGERGENVSEELPPAPPVLKREVNHSFVDISSEEEEKKQSEPIKISRPSVRRRGRRRR